MQAILLSIGDELTSGLTLNSNAPWLAQQLAALGIHTIAHLTVSDALLPIVETIQSAIPRCDLLLITGGLGPTADDLTRQALADALQEKLVEDPDAVLQIENWFNKHNRKMSPSNRLQALRPHSATVLDNPIGTAPGLRTQKDNCQIFVLPGVPGEMRAMFTAAVLPLLPKSESSISLVTKINTFGLGESILGERIKHLMSRNPQPDRGGEPMVGTTVHDGIVSVRIYASGSPEHTRAQTDRIRKELHTHLTPLIFGENEDSLESTVATLLKAGHYTVSTAESCTGGLLATLLTDIPGSSAYFHRGWITYANEAKHHELHVPEELLEKHGAVSEPVARAMAEGARKFSESDFALATTGIAGPDGGSPDKPVGTVWIALASPAIGGEPPHESSHIESHKFTFPGDRAAVRLRAAQMSLALLRWKLLSVPPPL